PFFSLSIDPQPTKIYTLSLHDALPIYWQCHSRNQRVRSAAKKNVNHQYHQHERDHQRPFHFSGGIDDGLRPVEHRRELDRAWQRSEEHTSELQSLAYLVCRLLLEKKKK